MCIRDRCRAVVANLVVLFSNSGNGNLAFKKADVHSAKWMKDRRDELKGK